MNQGKLDIPQSIQRAMQQLQSQQYESAAAIVDEILKAAPDHVDAMNLRGAIYDMSGNTDAAIEILTRATQLHPKHAGSWNNLGLANLSKKNVEQANAAFRKALEYQPELIDAAFNLARGLTAAHQFKEAEVWAQRVVNRAPQVADGQLVLASIKDALMDFEGAIAGYEKALELGAAEAGIKPRLLELKSMSLLVKPEKVI